MNSNRCLILKTALLVGIFCWWAIPGEQASGAQDSAGEQGGRGARRRSFDAASYLQRLDANGNGAIEPSELSDRSRRFVEGLGFNPDETNSLEKIKAKISGEQASSAREKSSETGGSALGSPERKIVRRVPGFETTAPARKGVPNFSVSKQPSGSELEGKYGDEIMQQVDAAMQRYDKNGDGKIDQGEMGEGRWGQPEPKESDLDKDGNLSRSEMAERYYRRTRGSGKDSGSMGSRTGETRGSSGARGSDSGNRSERSSSSREDSSSSRESRSGGSRESGTDDSRGESQAAAEEPRSGGGGGDRYRKYAEGLIQQYDTDKDGNLNKDEMKNMKQRPENADIDNNGLISPGELTEAIANGSMASGSGGSSGSSSGSRQRSSRSEEKTGGESNGASTETGSRSGASRSGSKFSFNASDKNGDGKVQMHEFTDEWTDEKFEEFKTYDKNGDGVISNTEYRGDSGRGR